MDFTRLIEWLIFGGVILYAIYMMISIKEEKTAYIENSLEFEFKNFLFFLPSWWTNTTAEEDSNIVTFERTDTRYDWKATFEWYKASEEEFSTPIEEIIVEKLEELKLIFDPEESQIDIPAKFEEFIPVKEGRIEIIHLEGTATEDQSERVYFDAYLIKDNINQAFLIANSRSLL
jgi:hypothetical protein